VRRAEDGGGGDIRSETGRHICGQQQKAAHRTARYKHSAKKATALDNGKIAVCATFARGAPANKQRALRKRSCGAAARQTALNNVGDLVTAARAAFPFIPALASRRGARNSRSEVMAL